MRRIFQFDGVDQGVLSIGECSAPDRVAVYITSNDRHEAQILLSRDDFKLLCSLAYDIHFMPVKANAQQLQETVEEDETPF